MEDHEILRDLVLSHPQRAWTKVTSCVSESATSVTARSPPTVRYSPRKLDRDVAQTMPRHNRRHRISWRRPIHASRETSTIEQKLSDILCQRKRREHRRSTAANKQAPDDAVIGKKPTCNEFLKCPRPCHFCQCQLENGEWHGWVNMQIVLLR